MPARLLVTGDTHLGARRNWLPAELDFALSTAELIVHTGDFSTLDAYQLFQGYGELVAVAGNNDDPQFAATLPDRVTLEAGGRTIAIVHGHLERGPSAKAAVVREFAGRVDLVIFGHSHQPEWEEVQGTWFLNPGSPTMKRRAPHFSFATIEIDRDGEFAARHVYFDEQIAPAHQRSG